MEFSIWDLLWCGYLEDIRQAKYAGNQRELSENLESEPILPFHSFIFSLILILISLQLWTCI
jgi:hypothetical protein